MKVLHINSYYATSHFYKNLYEEQIKQKLDISVFVPVGSEFNSGNFDYGNYTKIKQCFNKYDRLFFHIKQKKIEKKLHQEYDIQKFDLIHAHTVFTNGYFAYKANVKYGIPYVVAVRNTDLNIFFKKIIYLRKLGIKILANANEIVFLSSAYKDELLNKYVPKKDRDEFLKKSRVIPNGIDDFWFENIGSSKSFYYKKDIKLLYVGEISRNKNIITTIKAINELKKEGIRASLTVVGKIVDPNIFKRIIKNDFVKYRKPLPKEELLDVYRNHNIFVMPSIHESFGLVYAEAMSQGDPIIYTKHQGFDGQFNDGEVGYRVTAKDQMGIAKRIKKIILLYNDTSNNTIKHSYKFKWSKINLEYLNIYRGICREDRSR